MCALTFDRPARVVFQMLDVHLRVPLTIGRVHVEIGHGEVGQSPVKRVGQQGDGQAVLAFVRTIKASVKGRVTVLRRNRRGVSTGQHVRASCGRDQNEN